jgi:hypothetical protein
MSGYFIQQSLQAIAHPQTAASGKLHSDLKSREQFQKTRHFTK